MEVRSLQRRGMRNEVAGMQGEEVLSRHVRRALGSPTVQRRWIGLGDLSKPNDWGYIEYRFCGGALP